MPPPPERSTSRYRDIKMQTADHKPNIVVFLAAALAVCAGLFFMWRGGAPVAQASFNGYSYERSITISGNTAIASGTQSSFPMLVSSTVSSWENTGRGGNIQNICTAPNGGQEPCDLIYSMSSSCTSPLNFETESYSSSTGALIDWVNVPTMQASQVVYACYGNPSVSIDQSHPSATWNGNYGGVWHLSNGTALSGIDSTSNSNTFTNHSATAAASGKIGGGASFPGGAYMSVSNNSSLSFAFPFTVQMWMNFTTASNLVVLDNNGNSGYSFQVLSGSTIMNVGNTYAGDNKSDSDGNWHLITYVLNAATTTQVYVDGVYDTTVTVGTPSYAGGELDLGGRQSGYTFTGSVDEVRISNNARPANWIVTEYNNESNPSNFYALGSEQTSAGPTPIISSLSPTSTAAGSATTTLTVSGSNFISTSTVQWNGAALTTNYVSSSSLTATIPAANLAFGGTYSITVANPGTSNALTFTVTGGATNISAVTTQHWAWNDSIGWINFYSTGNVVVTSTQLIGYANSSFGFIALDCASSPTGNTCGTVNYKVTNNGAGTLSGYAWNDGIGWISFSCVNTGGCGTSSYGVTINSDGSLHGYAWSDAVGWISFNCQEPGICGTSNYDVVTSWGSAPAVGTLDSATFDTGSSTGAELNSVIWHGSLNGLLPGAVGFQFAVSAAPTSSSWTFTGPSGTTSTSDIYVGAGTPDTPIPITSYKAYSGFRYFRYRIILQTNTGQSISPKVTGVSVDWSP
jgi:hypothetical protein